MLTQDQKDYILDNIRFIGNLTIDDAISLCLKALALNQDLLGEIKEDSEFYVKIEAMHAKERIEVFKKAHQSLYDNPRLSEKTSMFFLTKIGEYEKTNHEMVPFMYLKENFYK